MPPRPILITGLSGTLGQAFERACTASNLHYYGLRRQQLDIADLDTVGQACEAYKPWAIINSAGYVRVDDAERDAAACNTANVTGPEVLARACSARGIRLLTFSTDLVFDGTKRTPYVESDAKAPLNEYGRSKAQAEALVGTICSDALIVRTSAFFGPWDEHNFATQTLHALVHARPVVAISDATVSPTYVPDLVEACIKLLLAGESGVWHLANQGEITWADLARRLAVLSGHDPSRIEGKTMRDLGLAAPRPHYSALGSERGLQLPPLEESLHAYMKETGWTA